jgi:hypothetical protein
VTGDWGELPLEDRAENCLRLQQGFRSLRYRSAVTCQGIISNYPPAMGNGEWRRICALNQQPKNSVNSCTALIRKAEVNYNPTYTESLARGQIGTHRSSACPVSNLDVARGLLLDFSEKDNHGKPKEQGMKLIRYRQWLNF